MQYIISFLVSAILIDKLKTTFDFIKKHYRIINLVSGTFLLVMGVWMASGTFGRFLVLLS